MSDWHDVTKKETPPAPPTVRIDPYQLMELRAATSMLQEAVDDSARKISSNIPGSIGIGFGVLVGALLTKGALNLYSLPQDKVGETFEIPDGSGGVVLARDTVVTDNFYTKDIAKVVSYDGNLPIRIDLDTNTITLNGKTTILDHEINTVLITGNAELTVVGSKLNKQICTNPDRPLSISFGENGHYEMVESGAVGLKKEEGCFSVVVNSGNSDEARSLPYVIAAVSDTESSDLKPGFSWQDGHLYYQPKHGAKAYDISSQTALQIVNVRADGTLRMVGDIILTDNTRQPTLQNDIQERLSRDADLRQSELLDEDPSRLTDQFLVVQIPVSHAEVHNRVAQMIDQAADRNRSTLAGRTWLDAMPYIDSKQSWVGTSVRGGNTERNVA